jgi:hypothetical protein
VACGWAFTFVLVTLAWIPFRAPDLQSQAVVFGKLGQWIAHPLSLGSSIYGLNFYVALACAFVLFELLDSGIEIEPVLARLPVAAQAVTILLCCVATYLGPAKDVAFLYFQF